MAVTSNALSSTLQLKVVTGQDADGKDIIKSKNYSNVKPSATNEDVYAVADAIGKLQKYTVSQIQRSNKDDLVNA